MDKQEAMARIAAIEDEAKRLRDIIDAPEVDDRKIIGKACFVADCRDKINDTDVGLAIVTSIKYDGDHRTQTSRLYRYARPATFAELGYPWVEDAKKFIDTMCNFATNPTWSIMTAQTEARRIAAIMEE